MPTISLAFNGDAFRIFEKFKDEPGLFFLDSSLPGVCGEFSYLGFRPFKIVSGKNMKVLKTAFAPYRTKGNAAHFSGGAVGYLSYEGEFFFGFYHNIIAFDHRRKRLMIHAANGQDIKNIQAKIQSALPPSAIAPFAKKLKFKSNFSKSQYLKAVQRALQHISDGDIYQINLSQRIEIPLPQWWQYARSEEIYQILRTHSPSSFSAYFHDGTQHILSSSPERFLKLTGRTAQVRPMKGTRPRGQTKIADRALKNDLLHSRKEIAELLMVTDLERNDLGRVCEYGSVKVKSMRTIEEYKTVFQATSTIEGQLRRGCDQFDLLTATFPSGSVTGCPKIEAMKIIKSLEGLRTRQLYTGVLGYIGFNGDMDFSVLIRTLFLDSKGIRFHVGGGIVADSQPLAEYEETWVKAQAMIDTLKKAFLKKGH